MNEAFIISNPFSFMPTTLLYAFSIFCHLIAIVFFTKGLLVTIDNKESFNYNLKGAVFLFLGLVFNMLNPHFYGG